MRRIGILRDMNSLGIADGAPEIGVKPIRHRMDKTRRIRRPDCAGNRILIRHQIGKFLCAGQPRLKTGVIDGIRTALGIGAGNIVRRRQHLNVFKGISRPFKFFERGERPVTAVAAFAVFLSRSARRNKIARFPVNWSVTISGRMG